MHRNLLHAGPLNIVTSNEILSIILLLPSQIHNIKQESLYKGATDLTETSQILKTNNNVSNNFEVDHVGVSKINFQNGT